MKRVFKQFQRILFNKEAITFFENFTIKMPFYAVARGRSVGIYESWGECEAQVKGFSGARYKKFDSPHAAQDFISTEGGPPPRSSYKSQNFAGSSKPYQNNLKRSYSSSAYSAPYSKGQSKPKYDDSSDTDHSDDSDGLISIVQKQMDDIEKRVDNFSKGINKIMNKNGGRGGRKAIMIEAPEPKRRRSNNRGFEEDGDGYIQVYTDGACSANGTRGARAGLGVYWGDGHELNISEPVSGRATNNCGEIQAATRAIKQALGKGITRLTINTDSKFLINSATKWMPAWKRKGWRLQSGEPVKNEIDFKDLDSVQDKLQIKWQYVEAHKGIHGNEMADKLARAGAAQYEK